MKPNNLIFTDKIIRCCDCHESFVFTAGEQGYYYNKGLADPKRCKSCRELRKRTILPEGVRHD